MAWFEWNDPSQNTCMIEGNFESDSYHLCLKNVRPQCHSFNTMCMQNRHKQSHNFWSLKSSIQVMHSTLYLLIYCAKMVNADCYGLSHCWLPYADLSGMLILFTKISKFHHENPQFLWEPIKLAIIDPSTAPDWATKLTIKATERT